MQQYYNGCQQFLSICVLCLIAGEEDLKQPLLPQIIDTETDVTVNKGRTAKLKCTVINQGTKTVKKLLITQPIFLETEQKYFLW